VRSTNKIRERDMDPAFLLSLINNAQSIDVTELLGSYLKKGDTIPRSSLPEDYVTAVNDAILALQAEVADIKVKYRKKSEPIGMADLDDELKAILTAMFYFLQHVKMQDDTIPVITYNEEGDRVIVVIDNDGNEYNVVIPVMYDSGSSGSFNAIDKARLQNQIDILQGQIATLTNTVDILQRTVNNIKNSGSSAGSNVIIDMGDLDINNIDDAAVRQLITIITSQASKITALENTINTLQGGSGSTSLANIVLQISQCKTDIEKLQTKISKKVQYNDLVVDLQNRFDNIADITRRIGTVESNKMNKPVLDEDGYLYYCADKGSIVASRAPVLSAAVCENAEDVISAQSNNEKFILNVQTGQGYQYDPVKKAYDIVQVSKNTTYNDLLIFNTQTEVIDYMVLNGSIIKLDSLRNNGEVINSANLFIRKVDIAAGTSVKIDRFNNLKKFPPLVLIYDLEADSRTFGKYINGEGVITVSHEEDSFTLHNDSVYELEVLVMAGD